MKKYLLPETGQFYKANLHCHSTLSDGRKTPEELKEIYKGLGYSVLAYTDHDLMIPHHALTDESFLALTGFEAEFNENNIYPNTPHGKTCHICFIAMKPDMEVQPCWHEKYAYIGNALQHHDMIKADPETSPFVRDYSHECISEMMQIGREKGFFVTYNHPTWSREDYSNYMGYTGMHAMEMFNGDCLAMGYEDYNPRVYDDMLRGGKRIFCIGADDNHNKYPTGDRNSGTGRAFTMIKVEKLSYCAVTEALEKGNFYASEGPEISALWYENGIVHITCSEAKDVYCTYGMRKGAAVYSEAGQPVREAEFPVPSDCGYFRLTVVDGQGRHACTNAYFTDEL